ncbi:glycosyltransferase family 22 protein [Lentinula aciculospora]|uniref:Mannosyltransferase n=1 Tax=Lentinula aciculospora TaxID=153920 RepID=A0A9W9AK15_9AGAR|nr:glycosyltransferase family 22 protein [Lentinula aciculospora]
MSFALDALIVLTGWTHVVLAPYNKVEESFNLHAVHDVLMYGITKLDQYDHFTFPGAVPRTFIGSVLLAWISYPVIQLSNSLGFVTSKFDLQVILRLVLSTLNALGLCYLRHAVSHRFGRPTSLYFTFITISQFHIPFWMGRTLPNMFALLPVNVASALLLSRYPNSPKPSPASVYTAIALLTSTAVIYRAELVLLLGPLVLQCLLSRYVSFGGVIKVGTVVGLLSMATTTAIDSYFWKTFVWPEFSGIYFNVVQGKSSQWGTSPPLMYFTSSLPSLLLFALPLSCLGCAMDSRIREALVPNIVFVGLISFLLHKEWRFIVYVVPVFNVAAARAGRWMVSQKKSGLLGRLLLFAFWAMIIVNALITTMFTMQSMANYPGGIALKRFNNAYPPLVPHGKAYHVHISNLAAQTGASLFLQEHAPPFPSASLFSSPTTSQDQILTYPWTVYDKTESLTLDELSGSLNITHLIAEWSPLEMKSRMRIWRVVDVDGNVYANTDTTGKLGMITSAGWKLDLGMITAVKGFRFRELSKLFEEIEWKLLRWEEEPKLWIYRRR